MPLLTTGAGKFPAIGGGAFDPASLYVGKKGCLFDLSNAATLFEERTGASATTPTAIDGVVGTILDLSGNGSHAVALADASRGLRRTGGYLELDNSNDYYSVADALIPGWNALSNTTYFASLRVTDAEGIFASHSASTGAFVFIYSNGSGSGVTSGFGTPSFYVDGSLQSSPTRDSMHDALNGADHTLLITSVNPTSVFNGITWFVDNGGSFYMGGRIYAFGAIEGSLDGTQTTNLLTWLDGLSP